MLKYFDGGECHRHSKYYDCENLDAVCIGTLHSREIVASSSTENEIPLWDWWANVYTTFSSRSLKSTSSLL